MEMLPIKPERRAQLDDYAQRHDQDAVAALDEALATYLEWERSDYEDAAAAARRGWEDIKAGRTRPADEFLAEVGRRHGFPS
jgi:predicted transcriptional regulator